MDYPDRCIFCGEIGRLTDEHVFSAPVRGLARITDETDLEWNDGSPQLWAGVPGAASIGDLTIHCVCTRCNNEWMGGLDGRFAKDLLWWSRHPRAKLGPQREQIIRRYLVKLLWVVRLGEEWATSAWIRGEAREPEFIPLSFVADGDRIASAKPAAIDELELKLYVGAARVDDQARQLLMLHPISVQGLARTSKLERVNAGIELTLRDVGLKLHAVVSSLDEDWQVQWPPGVVSLGDFSRYSSLPSVPAPRSQAPRLIFVGSGPAPDLELMYRHAFELARRSAGPEPR